MSSEKEYLRFSKGAVNYFEKLTEDSKYYHYVKPFVGGPDYTPFFQDFYAFLNIVQALNLSPRSKILDVGCGTGWISIYLAKLGHIATGIDISPDFISIANILKKNEKFPPFRDLTELTCEFCTHDLDTEPFLNANEFDCAIFYSTLHHLVYPEKVLKNILNYNLKENGKIIIYEGVKPPTDSVYEKKDYELMETYDTLERPFDPKKLCSMLKECGYDNITVFEPINGLFLRNQDSIRTIENILKNPPSTNVVIAFKPAKSFLAEISLKTNKKNFSLGENIILDFEVKNIGKITWRCKSIFSDDRFITIGARLYKEEKFISDTLPRGFLPNDVLPEEKVSIEWKWNVPKETGEYSLVFDMIFENYAWFQTRGSNEYIYKFVVQ